MTSENKPHSFCPEWADFPDIDLYMDQVISILERYLAPLSDEEKIVTPTMINNYVKQKIIPAPQSKRYSRSQIAFLFMICIWKRFMHLSDIGLLLENLTRTKTDEEIYSLFASELNTAISLFNENMEKKDLPVLSNTTEEALRSSCVAFASIAYARGVFLAAQKSWPSPSEENEEEKKKKEKKNKDKEISDKK